MYDKQTESLWIQVTGKAVEGPLRGKQLKFMPSTVTSWEKWKQYHPNTLVLPGNHHGGFYEGIDHYKDEDIGLSVMVNFKSKLYPFISLKRHPVVNDQFNNEDLLVVYFHEAKTATAWSRRLNGKSLSFKKTTKKDNQGNILIRDEQTGSLWSWLRGEALEGKLKGQKLEQLSYHPILIERFHTFYPNGPVFR